MKKTTLLLILLLLLSLLTGCAFLPTAEMQEDPFPDRAEPIENEEPNPLEELPEAPDANRGEPGSWFTEEPSIYIEVLDNKTQRWLTQYHEDIRNIKATLKEQSRHTNNMQTVTPAERRAVWSQSYWEYQTERFGEPFEERMVRNAIERNWVARTENEIIEFIVLAPDGSATVRMNWTIIYTSGNFDGLDFSRELNKPYHQRADVRLVFEEESWRINSIGDPLD